MNARTHTVYELAADDVLMVTVFSAADNGLVALHTLAYPQFRVDFSVAHIAAIENLLAALYDKRDKAKTENDRSALDMAGRTVA